MPAESGELLKIHRAGRSIGLVFFGGIR